MFSRASACLTRLLTENYGSLLRDFDLSNNRSLRSLEVTMENIARCPANAPRFLRNLVSTITSL